MYPLYPLRTLRICYYDGWSLLSLQFAAIYVRNVGSRSGRTLFFARRGREPSTNRPVKGRSIVDFSTRRPSAHARARESLALGSVRDSSCRSVQLCALPSDRFTLSC